MTMVIPAAQLSYASIEARGGRGGWQVVAHAGLDGDELQDMMLDGVLTMLDAPPMPRFPSADDIARQPRRLLCAPVRDGSGRVGVWHSAPAGADATGRPGNVFTHAAVFRTGVAGFRPIALWRSPSWLTPYGADQVSAARLPEVLEAADGMAAEASAFVLDLEVWRKGIFAVLLDAVNAALLGGPVAVLAIESGDKAALWIKAVSMCMAPGRAQTFAASTWESAGTRESWGRQGLHLVCVPRGDAINLPASDAYVVIDEVADPELGDWGGQPHRVAPGAEIPVTPWSVLVLDRLFTVQDGLDMMRGLDTLADEIPGDSPDPAWALGMLSALRDEQPIEGYLAAALAKAAPEGVKNHDKAYRLTTQAVRAASGTTTRDRWLSYQEVAVTSGSSFSAQLRALAYVETALADEEWLVAEDEAGGRFPREGQLDPPDDIREALLRCLSRQEVLLPEEQARRSVHLLDLGEPLIGEDDGLRAALLAQARSHVVPILDDQAQSLALTRTTVLGAGARRLLLAELERDTSPSRLSRAAVQWLELDQQELVNRDREGMPDGPSPLVTSAAFAAVESGNLSSMALDRLSMLLAWRLVLGKGTAHFRQAAAAGLAAHPVSAADVEWIRWRAGDRVLDARTVDAFLPTLLSAPRSSALDGLIDYFEWHPDRVASVAARARRAADDARIPTWADMGARRSIIRPLLRAWNRVAEHGGGRVDGVLAATIVLMRMLNQLAQPTAWEEQLRGIVRQATFTEDLWSAAAGGFGDWVRSRRIPHRSPDEAAAFMALLQVRDVRFPVGEGGQAPPTPLSSLASPQGTLLFERLMVETLSALDPQSVDSGVLDASSAKPPRSITSRPATTQPVDERALERRQRETEKALRGWLREHGIEAKRKSTFGLPRFRKVQE